MAFTFRFAEPFAQVKGSPIRELFRYLSQPGMISFAGGYPAPELFDEAGLQTSLLAVAHNLGTTLSYGATEGWPALRASFARLTTERAIPTQAEQLIVTSGSQQGFELLLRAFIQPGDRVVVERPTYPAALQGLRLAGANIVTIGSGPQGPDLAELDDVLRQHQPKLLYLVPTFANPTGATMDLQGRRRLLDLLAGTSCVLIEDDPYGSCAFAERRCQRLPNWLTIHPWPTRSCICPVCQKPSPRACVWAGCGRMLIFCADVSWPSRLMTCARRPIYRQWLPIIWIRDAMRSICRTLPPPMANAPAS